jgi:hypothetical protein
MTKFIVNAPSDDLQSREAMLRDLDRAGAYKSSYTITLSDKLEASVCDGHLHIRSDGVRFRMIARDLMRLADLADTDMQNHRLQGMNIDRRSVAD